MGLRDRVDNFSHTVTVTHAPVCAHVCVCVCEYVCLSESARVSVMRARTHMLW